MQKRLAKIITELDVLFLFVCSFDESDKITKNINGQNKCVLTSLKIKMIKSNAIKLQM